MIDHTPTALEPGLIFTALKLESILIKTKLDDIRKYMTIKLGIFSKF